MSSTPGILVLLALLAAPQPVAADSSSEAASFTGPLAQSLEAAGSKLVALAEAIPADKYTWRLTPDVRSVSEVFQHVTADNYLFASPYLDPPAWTEMNPSEYSTVQAFERREIDRDQVIEELEQSFAHLKTTMEMITDAKLAESVSFFGRTWTVQRLWVLTVTHLHEHLGQSIAYARTNGVVPPWSM